MGQTHRIITFVLYTWQGSSVQRQQAGSASDLFGGRCLADLGPIPVGEFVAGTGRKDPQDRFSGWALGHGAVMHHTQMTDRLTRRTIDRNGQITFYPIFLEPGILGENPLQVGGVIGEAIGENLLAGCVFEVVFELLPVT